MRTRERPLLQASARPRTLSADVAVLGLLVGVVGVVLVSGIPGSPLSPPLPPGAGPMAPLRALSRAVGLTSLSGGWQAVAAVVAVALAVIMFLFALREAWRGNLSLRLVVGVGLALDVLAVALPLLFSRDVYSYSIYGRIVSVYHSNPYVRVPNDFSHDPVFPFVGHVWRGTPPVYGPAFTMLSAGFARIIHSTWALILAFKLVAGVAGAAILLLVARLAKRLWPERAAFAAALLAFNPVFLFLGVAGGHNDLLVGLCLAGATVILVGGHARSLDGDLGSVSMRRELAVTAVLALATLVKVVAAVPLLLWVVAAVSRRAPGRRIRPTAWHVVVAAAVAAPFAVPFLQAHDPSLGMFSLAGHQGWLAPSFFFQLILVRPAHFLFGRIAGGVVEGIIRIGFALVLVSVVAALVRRTARWASGHGLAGTAIGSAGGAAAWPGVVEQAASWGWALLLVMLLSPVLIAWYAVWVLPFAWLMPRVPRIAMVVAVALLGMSQWVAEPLKLPTAFHILLWVGHYIITPILIALLVWLLRDLRARLRDGLPLADGAAPLLSERARVPAGSDRA